MDRTRTPGGAGRRWPWLAGVGVLCTLVPAALALTGACQGQVATTATGALMTTAGFGLGQAAWPGWRRSDPRRLALSLGFLIGCAGAILMLAGIGIYH